MSAYQKIAGSGKRFYGPLAYCKTKLHQGPDHLLQVDQYGFLFTFYEKYRRFYYADIQGVTVQETNTSLRWTLLWSVLLLLLLGFTLYLHSMVALTWGMTALLSVLVLPCLFLLGHNFLLGPSCRVKIHTAVQSEVLPSVNRFKRAENFLALLQPLIREAQGTVSETDASSLSSPAATSFNLPSKLSSPPSLPESVTRPRSAYFVGLSISLILHSLCTGLLFFQPGIMSAAASTILGISASIFWVAAMIQASRYRVSPKLRRFGWITLGYLSALYMVSFMFYAFSNWKNPALSYDAMEWLRLIGEDPVSQSYFLLLYDSFIVLGSGLLGLSGLVLQRSKNKPAAPAS